MSAQRSIIFRLGLLAVPGVLHAASLELTPVTIRVLDERTPPARAVLRAQSTRAATPLVKPARALNDGNASQRNATQTQEPSLDSELDSQATEASTAAIAAKSDKSLDNLLDSGMQSRDEIQTALSAPLPEWKVKSQADHRVRTRPSSSGLPGLIDLEGPQELGLKGGVLPSFEGDVNDLKSIESRYRMSQAPVSQPKRASP